MKKRRSFFDNEELINLTPLLDVLFVVLVMFILITPMVNMDSISLTKVESKKKENASQNQDILKILVNSDNQITMNGVKVNYSEFKTLISQVKNKEKAQLFCDQKARFGVYQKIKSLMQEADFKELQVVIEHE